jgi:hypothetical protein
MQFVGGKSSVPLRRDSRAACTGLSGFETSKSTKKQPPHIPCLGDINDQYWAIKLSSDTHENGAMRNMLGDFAQESLSENFTLSLCMKLIC